MSQNQIHLPPCFGCNHCGYRSSALKAVCPKCGSKEIAAVGGAQEGKVVDFVPVFFPPENLKHLGRYISALVKLDNGCQIFGIVLGDPKDIQVGSTVVVSSFNSETKELYFKIA
jgi:uncharacterized OB-fold protein